MKKKKRISRFTKLMIAVFLLILSYSVFVYSEVRPIADIRNIYIETVMTSGSHQWMATYFIPKNIIDKTMNKQLVVTKETGGISKSDSSDKETNSSDITSNSPNIIIPKTPISKDDNIFIKEVSSDTYKGVILEIKDASKIKLVATDKPGAKGRYLKDLIQQNDAIAGINATGFADYGGSGSGGQVVGQVKIDSQIYGKRTAMDSIALTYDGKLLVGNIPDYDKDNIQYAMQFSPTLIANGKILVEGSSGWGVHPRTAIGQKEDGTIVFLVIAGRQIGYSIGATVGDCAQLLYDDGCVNAGCLDGGSSSLAIYRGEQLITSSSPDKNGRWLPTAFVVTN